MTTPTPPPAPMTTAEERSALYCGTCGVPWEEHTADCPRDAFRPKPAINGEHRETWVKLVKGKAEPLPCDSEIDVSEESFLRHLLSDCLEVLIGARRAMTNQRYSMLRIGMETECAACDAMIANIKALENSDG